MTTQTFDDIVTIFVTQQELQPQATKLDSTSASTIALQYIAENLNFDVVTFQVNFSESTNIKLIRPAEPGSTSTLRRATKSLVFDCKLRPFERRTLAYVTKKEKKRAHVRVHYVLKAVVAPSVDAIAEAKEKVERSILLHIRHSDGVFNLVNKWKAVPSQPRLHIAQVCDEINRFFRLGGDVFVDATFPPLASSLCDCKSPFKLPEADSAIYTLSTWEHLHSISDSSWTFVTQPHELSTKVTFTCGLPAQDSFLSALTLIAPHCEMWLHRWFPTLNTFSQLENMVAVPVTLCSRGLTWQHLLVDLFFPSFPLGCGLMTSRNVHGELYPLLLHKAYAKLKGSYRAVAGIPTMKILQELTGSPWVCCYRKSTSKQYADPFIGQVQLQEAVQVAMCNRRMLRGKDLLLVVVTCGKIDNHQEAFQLTVSREDDSRLASVVLHGAHKKLLDHQLIGDSAKSDHRPASSTTVLSWEELFELEPTVWSFSFDRQHEQRLRRILLHDGKVVKMASVISVSTLTTIVISFSYLAHFLPESCHQQVELDVSIELVEGDFSLTPIEITSAGLEDEFDGHNSVFRKQVVQSLSAGEYVVSVLAKRISSSSEAAKLDLVSAKTALTPSSVDTNLQLVFNCLDIEGKHELSESDVCNFLQLYEHIAPSLHGNEKLCHFLEKFGRPGLKGKSLTLEDIRDIYLGLAIQSRHGDSTDNLVSSVAIPSACNRSRFKEFIWHDLVRLLSSSKPNAQADFKAEDTCVRVECRNIVEIVCSFHSNTPLLNVVLLPEDKGVLEVNNI